MGKLIRKTHFKDEDWAEYSAVLTEVDDIQERRGKVQALQSLLEYNIQYRIVAKMLKEALGGDEG